MMYMMNNASWGFGSPLFWGLHVLSVIAFFAGITLLLMWAFRELPAKQLILWGMGLVIGGSIICLLALGGWKGSRADGDGFPYMMQREPGESDRQFGMMNDLDDTFIGMNGMMDGLEGFTGEDFDRAFIQMMIPHHQGAINMAEAALENAQHPEIRAMAEDIIEAQQAEIDMMRSWQEVWGYRE